MFNMGIQDWSDAATIAAFCLSLLLVVEEALAWSKCESNSILQVLSNVGGACRKVEPEEPVIVQIVRS